MIINGINITINRKNIKNLYLKVTGPEGNVNISAPKNISDNEIIEFINNKMDWIIDKQTKIKNTEYTPPLKYLNGEKHYLWGEAYELQLIKNTIKTPFTKENKIYLPVSNRSKIKNRQKLLENYYRSELKKEISNIYKKCTSIVGEKPKEVKIRKMKNWGNCKQNGVITLNLNLAKKDKKCLEYVFIHELCHLIEFNHSKNFYKLMDEKLPKWREIKKKLNEG